MPAAVPRYLSAASSDQGLIRPNNEDRVYCDESRGIFAVIDGMGGHEAGEVAADIALQRLRARLERQTDSVEQRLREAITLANNAIFEAAESNSAWEGMACVLTAAVIENEIVTVGHVGDSRLYRVKRGAIEKLTHDHSPVGEREDSGELTERAAMQHPRRNEVFRDVGSQEHTPDDPNFIETFTLHFPSEGALLLCSDGLSDALSSEQILSTIEQNASDPVSVVHSLIKAATAVGKDNVSVVWIEGQGFAHSFAPSRSVEQLSPAVPPASFPWYGGRGAYALYGALLGAAFLFAIQAYVFPELNLSFRPPRTVIVTVPSSIGEALRAAREGDTVAVGPGIYSEAVTLKEGVNLVARQAGEAVIERGVTADNLRSARLEGFQIRGEEVGIRVHNSAITLARDEISGARDSGIEFSGDSRGIVFGCTVHNNGGPGITLAGSASPSIQNNLIANNGKQRDRLRPGLIIHSSARPVIAGNIFAGNGAEAVWLPAADEAVLQQNSFFIAGTSESRPKLKILPLAEGRP